ncbi:putative E3 ubiquitin-protein ligase MARCH6 [Paratrimastix pyriformis]|uniref:E3 ubiquitin-protein ligase MARCH6 n=1 Tax=Paratrimastix pyriformis TaxID=342808 RepID=A0ABQ8UFS2_9EUKA|nr:putative E3 ubiquitin-protein ligase MARCH6 [Paratrimastix pyriformis]
MSYMERGFHENNPEKEGEGAPLCRICRGEDTQENLIHPCLCTGSLRYVHESCLKEWIKRTQASSVPPHCEICRHEYSMDLPGTEHLLSDFIYFLSPLSPNSQISETWRTALSILLLFGFFGGHRSFWKILFFSIFVGLAVPRPSSLVQKALRVFIAAFSLSLGLWWTISFLLHRNSDTVLAATSPGNSFWTYFLQPEPTPVGVMFCFVSLAAWVGITVPIVVVMYKLGQLWVRLFAPLTPADVAALTRVQPQNRFLFWGDEVHPGERPTWRIVLYRVRANLADSCAARAGAFSLFATCTVLFWVMDWSTPVKITLAAIALGNIVFLAVRINISPEDESPMSVLLSSLTMAHPPSCYGLIFYSGWAGVGLLSILAPHYYPGAVFRLTPDTVIIPLEDLALPRPLAWTSTADLVQAGLWWYARQHPETLAGQCPMGGSLSGWSGLIHTTPASLSSDLLLLREDLRAAILSAAPRPGPEWSIPCGQTVHAVGALVFLGVLGLSFLAMVASAVCQMAVFVWNTLRLRAMEDRIRAELSALAHTAELGTFGPPVDQQLRDYVRAQRDALAQSALPQLRLRAAEISTLHTALTQAATHPPVVLSPAALEILGRAPPPPRRRRWPNPRAPLSAPLATATPSAGPAAAVIPRSHRRRPRARISLAARLRALRILARHPIRVIPPPYWRGVFLALFMVGPHICNLSAQVLGALPIGPPVMIWKPTQPSTSPMASAPPAVPGTFHAHPPQAGYHRPTHGLRDADVVLRGAGWRLSTEDNLLPGMFAALTGIERFDKHFLAPVGTYLGSLGVYRLHPVVAMTPINISYPSPTPPIPTHLPTTPTTTAPTPVAPLFRLGSFAQWPLAQRVAFLIEMAVLMTVACYLIFGIPFIMRTPAATAAAPPSASPAPDKSPTPCPTPTNTLATGAAPPGGWLALLEAELRGPPPAVPGFNATLECRIQLVLELLLCQVQSLALAGLFLCGVSVPLNIFTSNLLTLGMQAWPWLATHLVASMQGFLAWRLELYGFRSAGVLSRLKLISPDKNVTNSHKTLREPANTGLLFECHVRLTHLQWVGHAILVQQVGCQVSKFQPEAASPPCSKNGQASPLPTKP